MLLWVRMNLLGSQGLRKAMNKVAQEKERGVGRDALSIHIITRPKATGGTPVPSNWWGLSNLV